VRKLTISVEGVGRLDTFGVWALERLRRSVVAAGADFSISQAGTPLLEVPINQLCTTFEQAIPRRMGADLPPTV
jgi:hypothetical protein